MSMNKWATSKST